MRQSRRSLSGLALIRITRSDQITEAFELCFVDTNNFYKQMCPVFHRAHSLSKKSNLPAKRAFEIRFLPRVTGDIKGI